MRRKSALRVVLAVAIVGIAFPVLAALYLAHRQSMDAEIELADTMAVEVLRRVDEAGDQANHALQRVTDDGQAPACTEHGLTLLRDIYLESSHLQIVGFVVDGRMMCSSLGMHGEGIDLGPVDYVSTRDAKVRTSVDFGSGHERRLLVLQKGELAAAMQPGQLIDTFVERSQVALGVYGASGERRLASRGFFDRRWIERARGAASSVFFDGSYLVSTKRSAKFDTVAYVAVPVADLRNRFLAFARVLVPISLVLAAGLSFGIIRLARQRASLPSELRSALKRREFEVHYQPIVELRTRRIVGIEALLRWPNRDGPLLRPDLFVPVAEECGLIPQFTNYVLERVAVDAPRLIAVDPDAYVSINLSSTDLHSEEIVAALQKLLQTRGIQPRNILVEATEHSLVDPDRAQQVVSRIRKLGIRVAIDDFGTGYSSLSHLTTLRTDYLKIDKVFIDALGTDSVTSQVAMHVISIAESLDLKIIGEGVETEVQARFLGEQGVQFAQGWLFHEAMRFDQLLEVFRRNAAASAQAEASPRMSSEAGSNA